MKILIVLAAVMLAGCVSQEQQARTLFDRLEFDEDERGCFRLNGQIDLSPVPFVSSSLNISLVKRKGKGPDC